MSGSITDERAELDTNDGICHPAILEVKNDDGSSSTIGMAGSSGNYLPRIELAVMPIVARHLRSELRLKFEIVEAVEGAEHLNINARTQTSYMMLNFNCYNIKIAPMDSLQPQKLTSLPGTQVNQTLHAFQEQRSTSSTTFADLSLLTIHHDASKIFDLNLFSGREYPGLNESIKVLRRTVRSGQPLQLLVKGVENLNIFAQLKQSFLDQRINEPLSGWYKSPDNGLVPANQLFTSQHEPLPPHPDGRPLVKLKSPKQCFDSLPEYIHFMGFSAKHEEEHRAKTATWIKATAIVYEVLDGDDRTYSVCLTVNYPDEMPKRGERLSISFKSQGSRKVIAHVISWDFSEEQTSIYVTIECPSSLSTRRWKLQNYTGIAGHEIVRLVKSEGMESSPVVYEEPPKVKVQFQVLDSNLPLERVKLALLTLQDSDLSKEMTLVRKILQGTQLDQLPTRNLLSSTSNVRDLVAATMSSPEFHSETLGTLNSAQAKAMDRTSVARAGINIIEGPAGSGKSYTAMIFAQIKLLCVAPEKKRSRLLSVYPVNEAASCGAVSFKEQLRKFWRESGGQGHPVVVRLHSRATERQIFIRQLVKNGFREHATGNIEPSTRNTESVNVAATQLSSLTPQDDEVRELRERIDPRLTVPECALGWFAEQELMRPSSNGFANREPLVQYLEQYLSGNAFEVEKEVLMNEHIDDLFQHVLSKADAVFTTISNAHDPILCKAFEPDVLILDEAAKIKESEIVGIFVYYGKTVQDYFFVGDRVQGVPFAKGGAEGHAFSKQEQYSAFDRMVDLGHTYTLLTEQKRSVTAIAQPVSKRFYKKPLTTPPERDTYECALRASQFVKERFRIDNSLLTVKVSYTTTKRVNHSRFNKSTARAAVDIIVDAIDFGYKGSDLAILSPYTASVEYLKGLVRESPRLSRADKKSLLVQSFDKIQGTERSIVVLEYPNTKEARFIAEDARNYSALTRAADAAILVMDVERVMEAEEFEDSGLGRLVALMVIERHVYLWRRQSSGESA